MTPDQFATDARTSNQNRIMNSILRYSRSTVGACPSQLRVLGARRNKHTLPDLPYDYNALEPFISAEIMQLHHSKHHQAYVSNLNVFEAKYADAQASRDLKSMISLQGALKFNGGGHINHSIFWTNLAPPKLGGGEAPTGNILSQINKDFGSVDSLTAKFNAESAGVQGSGWGWLGWNKTASRLEIATTGNQDPLLHLVPVLGVDVWEHAYYLQYKNVRPDYLKAVWSVVNWKNVGERLALAQKK